jgi:hypothetical protein
MKKALLTITVLLMLLPPLAQAQDYYRIRKHPRISTGLEEAAAVPYEDGVVYITQSTSVGISSPRTRSGEPPFTIFHYKDGGQKQPFNESMFTMRHEGPVSFSADYTTMVFSQQRSSSGSKVDPLGLYFAENVEGRWTNIRAYEHNDDNAWYFSPALSPDGKTLFFSANRSDTIGGFDLYFSERTGSGWTEPENLGPAVNTDGNELYPFIHQSGVLYFSSDGHDQGVAGYDLFQTARINGRWSSVTKLPAPFNSLSDDYHVYFSGDYKTGYLTTNRGSSSKEIYTFETDIPALESPQPIKKTYYKYRIYDRNLDTIDTNLFRYSWVINDTLEIPGHDIIYEFPRPGTYVCKLNVHDIQLDTLVEGQTVRTLEIKLNQQAVIISPDTVQMNEPVTFDGSQTFLPGFDIGRYIWDFGDGSFGEGIRATHIYRYPGVFRVILGVEERKQNRRHEPEVKSNFRDVVVTTSD